MRMIEHNLVRIKMPTIVFIEASANRVITALAEMPLVSLNVGSHRTDEGKTERSSFHRRSILEVTFMRPLLQRRTVQSQVPGSGLQRTRPGTRARVLNAEC